MDSEIGSEFSSEDESILSLFQGPPLSKKDFSNAYSKQIAFLAESFQSFLMTFREVDEMGVGDHAKSVRNSKSTTGSLNENRAKGVVSTKAKKVSKRKPSMRVYHKKFSRPIIIAKCQCRCSSECDRKLEAVYKKLDSVCSFLHHIFSHQVEVLGKNYQAQMGVYKKVEELTEEVEEDIQQYLVSVEKELGDLKSKSMHNLKKKVKACEDGVSVLKDAIANIEISVNTIVEVVTDASKRLCGGGGQGLGPVSDKNMKDCGGGGDANSKTANDKSTEESDDNPSAVKNDPVTNADESHIGSGEKNVKVVGLIADIDGGEDDEYEDIGDWIAEDCSDY